MHNGELEVQGRKRTRTRTGCCCAEFSINSRNLQIRSNTHRRTRSTGSQAPGETRRNQEPGRDVVITNLIVTLIVSDSVVDASSQRQLQSRRRAPEWHRDHKATETQRCDFDFDFDFMNQNRLSLEQMSLPSSLRIPRPIQNLLSVGKSEKHRTAGGASLCPSDTRITSTQTAACFPGKSQSVKGRRLDGSKLLLKHPSRQDADEGKGAEVDAFANVGIDELSYNHRYCRSTGSTYAASDLSPPHPPSPSALSSTSDVRDRQSEGTDR